MTDTRVIDDLQTARAELVARGWCQGGLTNGVGNVCAVGALNIACCGNVSPEFGQNWEKWDRRDDAAAELKRFLPHGGEIANFNDDPTTTKQDILDLFDKTLADLGGLA